MDYQVVVLIHPRYKRVRLGVQDFGIGISLDAQQNVFKQFYRVTGENQSTFQGMGIGLYICAEIIYFKGWVLAYLYAQK